MRPRFALSLGLGHTPLSRPAHAQQALAGTPPRPPRLEMAQHTDRTMGQIEELQMQIGELEREANKQSSTGAALEHADQAEEREVE